MFTFIDTEIFTLHLIITDIHARKYLTSRR